MFPSQAMSPSGKPTTASYMVVGCPQHKDLLAHTYSQLQAVDGTDPCQQVWGKASQVPVPPVWTVALVIRGASTLSQAFPTCSPQDYGTGCCPKPVWWARKEASRDLISIGPQGGLPSLCHALNEMQMD